MIHLKEKVILAIFISFILIIALCNVSNAAPSGSIGAPSGSVEDNVLELDGGETVTVTFKNTAGASLDDVASTIQYITLAAANLNPSRVQIDSLEAKWEIYDSTNTLRISGTVYGELDGSAIYSPYSTTQTVHIYTWKLGKPSDTLDAYTASSQFENTLRVLRPGETIKLIVNVKCQGLVGDSMFWFFFKATEAHYAEGNYPTSINGISDGDRMNLYYSKIPKGGDTKYWLPLHNSYDPYDADIGTGHNFDQHSWTRGATTHAFAKGNKIVHQKPQDDPEDPEEPTYSFHICGIKFNDLDRDGLFDAEVEQGIDGVTVTLLGPDMKTLAEKYYEGAFNYPYPEGNPLLTGENQLKGSYCFNLEDVEHGSYTFYVKIEEPAGREATTPILIGPITLEADEDGPYESLNNNFGNSPPISPPPTRPPYVGGKVYMVNKLIILAPYLALISLVSIIIVAFKKQRR
ncbi:hypothetical protein KEJ50_03050 [Candidatus Bathyarchaeota archaeon]|nr:hypothetical protein [Candidatus Bathyarchaeota archaeon]